MTREYHDDLSGRYTGPGSTSQVVPPPSKAGVNAVSFRRPDGEPDPTCRNVVIVGRGCSRPSGLNQPV